ncbi:hypothetical protein DLAC_09315 [Tieghemostelium lacteum]|uniref:Uncharacterized protein n=1 Tax=Tieghemostelium lacteum TaxID=361077 RepID=A0A151Z9Q6_TIELA|nr:hypothetical protein DLAC_09315 [Tieghemostelium lacteum]|eukprot:KYQ90679.1 hypothetical protein DLAC_09315 [Tieghemostelium lacteum]
MNSLVKSINSINKLSLINKGGSFRFYSTLEEIKLKTKVPVFKQYDDAQEHIAIGKLKESEHSLALINLEFISIDHLVNLSPEDLSRLVVIPKAERVSTDSRLEKLEQDITQIKEMLKNRRM